MKPSPSLVCLVQLALCGSLFLVGCPAADGTGGKTTVLGIHTRTALTESVAEVPRNNDELLTQVLHLVNERRVAIGLKEVTLNPVLTRIAEEYCETMIQQGFFGHQDPVSLETAYERAIRHGYLFVAVGENLAAGQESAEQVFDEWMASPEHREIILDVQWREIGVGVRLGGEHGVYWALEFGNPP